MQNSNEDNKCSFSRILLQPVWTGFCIVMVIAMLILSACQVVPSDTVNTNPQDTATQPADTDGTESSADHDTSEITETTNRPTTEQTETETTAEESTDEESGPQTDTDIYTDTDTETDTETSAAPTSRQTTAAPTTRQTAAVTTTRQTTAATTTRKITAAPTSTPTPSISPTSTPVPQAAGQFPYKNYGTYFRDDYGSNSKITESPNGGIFVDTGSTPNGVVLVRVNSSAIAAGTRCKAIFRDGDGNILFQYNILVRDRYVGLPLNRGNGPYNLLVAKNVGGDSYTPEMLLSFNVSLTSSLKPFTAASVMSDFSRGSTSVQRANSLTSGITTADGKVSAVYSWIVANISYDRDLANSISSSQITYYLPDPDRTMASRKGICFDYASLMCAMLRSQGIPTRLIMGSTPQGYHAWNEVYFEGSGWVVVAEFKWKKLDGSGWVQFDTTFAAGGLSPATIQSTSYTRSRVY